MMLGNDADAVTDVHDAYGKGYRTGREDGDNACCDVMAERDRYREALREIAAAPLSAGRLSPGGESGGFSTLQQIARKALEEG